MGPLKQTLYFRNVVANKTTKSADLTLVQQTIIDILYKEDMQQSTLLKKLAVHHEVLYYMKGELK